MNPCHFSPCRRYRYALTHDVEDLFGAPAGTGYVAWIGLNPSRADESRLDPTLWRVRAYTHRSAYPFRRQPGDALRRGHGGRHNR